MQDVKVTLVKGNSQKLDGGAMFGNAPRAMWQNWIQPDELGRIPLNCQALLIEVGSVKILCETGIGAFFDEKMADRFGIQNPTEHMLIKNLHQLGFNEDDINFVILSHLHFDHAGGLMPSYQEQQAGNNELKFKNAKYVVGEEALERSKNPHSRDKASFIPGLYEKLTQSQRLIVVKKGEATVSELPSCIEFIYSHGHTPGQMLTKVKGSNKSVIFTGDLIPGTQWVHVPITMGYDRFAEKVIDEKKALYEGLNLQSSYLFYTHDCEFAMSRLEKDDRGKYSATEPLSELVRYPI